MKEIIVRLTSDHIKVKGAEYVQDLVRCRDCKYLEVHGKTTMHYWCDQWEHYTDEDSFCANSAIRDVIVGLIKGANDEKGY